MLFEFFSSAFRSRDIKLLMKKIFPVFASFFCIQENCIIDSLEAWWILLQCHISFYLKHIGLLFRKPLAGEKPSFISNVFQILQNN